jgi:hypothetical protein
VACKTGAAAVPTLNTWLRPARGKSDGLLRNNPAGSTPAPANRRKKMFNKLREKIFLKKHGIKQITQDAMGETFLENLQNPECLRMTLVAKKPISQEMIKYVLSFGFTTMFKNLKDGIEYQFIRNP